MNWIKLILLFLSCYLKPNFLLLNKTNTIKSKKNNFNYYLNSGFNWLDKIYSQLKKISWYLIILYLVIFVTLYISNLIDINHSNDFVNLLYIIICPLDINHIQLLNNTQAGIGAVLVGEIFFVALVIFENQGKHYHKFVIINRTKLIELLFATIILYFFLSTNYMNSIVVFAQIVLAIFTFSAIVKTFVIMINDEVYTEYEKHYIRDVMLSSFIKLTFHYSNNKNFLDKFNSLKNNFIFTSSNKDTDMKIIHAKKTGFVVGIDNNKLQVLFDLLNNLITFSRNDLLIKYNYCNYLEKNKDVVFWLKKELYQNKAIKWFITVIINKCIITSNDRQNINSLIGNITKNTNQIIVHINYNNINEINFLLSFYPKLIIYWYEIKKLFNRNISNNVLHILNDNIKEIVEKGILSPNSKIQGSISYFSFSILRSSIDFRDNSLFNIFNYLPLFVVQLIYYHKKNKALMLDKTFRHLNEFVRIYFLPRLHKQLIYNNYCLIKDILKIYQNIMKFYFDKNEIEHFKNYLNIVHRDFYNLLPDNIHQNPNVNKFNMYFIMHKNTMIFGLLNWTIYKHHEGGVDFSKYTNLLSKTLNLDFYHLSNCYIKLRNYDVVEYWKWDNWELFEKEENIAHGLNTLYNLDVCYIYLMLNQLFNLNITDYKNIDNSIYDLFKDKSNCAFEISKILNHMDSDRVYWNRIISDEMYTKIDILINYFNNLSNFQKQIHDEKIRQAKISPDRIKIFKSNFNKAFESNSIMRNIIAQTSGKSGVVPNININFKKQCVIRQLVFDSKTAFIDDPSLIHLDWGESFGEGFAESENLYLLDKIEGLCKRVNSVAELSNYITDDFIILSSSYGDLSELKSQISLISKDNHLLDDVNNVDEFCKINNLLIPIYDTYHSKKRNKVYFVDRTKIGKIIQYNAIDEDNFALDSEEQLFIKIQSFKDNEKLLNYFLDNPTKSLKRIVDRQERKRYLLGKIYVFLSERFEYQNNNENIGFVIDLNDIKKSKK